MRQARGEIAENAYGRAAGSRPEGEAHIKPDPPGAAHWIGAKRRMRRSRIGWAAAHARRERRAGAGLNDQQVDQVFAF